MGDFDFDPLDNLGPVEFIGHAFTFTVNNRRYLGYDIGGGRLVVHVNAALVDRLRRGDIDLRTAFNQPQILFATNEHKRLLTFGKVEWLFGPEVEPLALRAERYLYRMGSSDLYSQEGGVLRHLVKLDHPSWSEDEIDVEIQKSGLDPEFVPLTAILRDVLPLLITVRKLLRPLTKGYVDARNEWLLKFADAAKDFKSGDEVVSLPLATLREITNKLTLGKSL